VYTPEEVPANAVRGQYGAGRKADGSQAAAYRDEPDVSPASNTETFVALRMFIDNWRWEGVPIYLRSGKALWKRGTDIMVQFKKTPEVIFRDTPAAGGLKSNKLIFHVQPDQGIELRFSAKTPGPRLTLQPVNMRFDYRESFEASRGTGYEVLVYNCMTGDQTLFLRSDLVETAWRVAQPILDYWESHPATDFPNYRAGSWGPKGSFDLIEADERRWQEVVNRSILERVPLFAKVDDLFLHQLAMMLYHDVYAQGDDLIKKGAKGREMFFLSRGEVEVLDDDGKRIALLQEGAFFGETSLILTETTTRTVRAVTDCDVFVLDKSDFRKVLRDHPDFAKVIAATATERYEVDPKAAKALEKK
jgi:glucose-6-phosphate 1-dehydrogenase